jgi:hypothetical protein
VPTVPPAETREEPEWIPSSGKCPDRIFLCFFPLSEVSRPIHIPRSSPGERGGAGLERVARESTPVPVDSQSGKASGPDFLLFFPMSDRVPSRIPSHSGTGFSTGGSGNELALAAKQQRLLMHGEKNRLLRARLLKSLCLRSWNLD